jgi:hypothetical protein
MAAERYTRIIELRQKLQDHQDVHLKGHSSRWHLVKSVGLSMLIHSPIGNVFSHSIVVSHSMRALFLISQLFGDLMIVTLFCQATGGALSKRSGERCASTCKIHEATGDCLGRHLGRAIAVGLGSMICAGIPVVMMNALHSRHFTRVSGEGEADWNRQLFKWRCRTISIWVIGILYCLFAFHYCLLFFANVAGRDHEYWWLSASVTMSEDAVIVPLTMGLFIAITAHVMTAVICAKFGVSREKLLHKRKLTHLAELFDRTDNYSIKHDLSLSTPLQVLRQAGRNSRRRRTKEQLKKVVASSANIDSETGANAQASERGDEQGSVISI